MAGAFSLHHVIPDDLYGVQGLPDHGAADGGGEAGQVVQGAFHRYPKAQTDTGWSGGQTHSTGKIIVLTTNSTIYIFCQPQTAS